MFRRLTVLILLSVLSSGPLAALPEGGVVAYGDVCLNKEGKRLQIKASNNAIIDWDRFSIGKDEEVEIVLQDPSCRILNRDKGELPSEIGGSFTSNGTAYLVNERGAIILQKGTVSSHGFYASTVDVLNEEFSCAHPLIFKGTSPASIVNFGTVDCRENIVFISDLIENQNSLKSTHGGIFLGSSGKSSKSVPSVDNSGIITARCVTLYSVHPALIRNTGIILAFSCEKKPPSIVLRALKGTVSNENLLRAEDGSVSIEAETVSLKKLSIIDVSGPKKKGAVTIDPPRMLVEEGALISEQGEK